MKFNPDSALYLCPMCMKLMDKSHNYEVTLSGGLTLGPVCSADCAHSLFLAYTNYWRVVSSAQEIKC